MKTSGERRKREPTRPPATPTASAATKTAASSPTSAPPSSFAPSASTVAAHMSSASRKRARSVTVNASPAATAARRCDAVKAVSGHDVGRRPEPARRDRAADADAEDEAEQLDERAGRVRDARLEVLGRQLAHADRERHPGQEGDEGGERDDVGRRVEPELGRGRRRRSWRRRRRAVRPSARFARARFAGIAIAPTRSPTSAPASGLAPAAAEHRRQRGAGERVRREQDRPRAARAAAPDHIVERRERLGPLQAVVEHVPDQVVEPGDRVQVDGRRPHAERVRALVREATRARARPASASRDLDVRRAERVRRARARAPRGRRSG